MKLLDAVAQYVTLKQSMGMRFNSEQRILKSFCCHQEGTLESGLLVRSAPASWFRST